MNLVTMEYENNREGYENIQRELRRVQGLRGLASS